MNDFRLTLTEGRRSHWTARMTAQAHLLFASLMLALIVPGGATNASDVRQTAPADEAILATVEVGTNARGLAFNPATNKIYVANIVSSDVTVVDASRYEVLKTIPIETRVPDLGPEAIAVDPSRNLIYVEDTTGDVWIVDGDTDAIIDRLSSFEGWINPLVPRIAVNPATNILYVANRFDEKRFVVIDGASKQILKTFPDIYTPMSIVINDQTNRVYVANSAHDFIAVIDGGKHEVVARISGFPAGPVSLAVSPTTNRLYATDEGNPRLYVIDISTNEVIATLEDVSGCFFCAHVAVSTTGHRVYYLSAGELVTIDTASNAVIARRPLRVDAWDIEVNPLNGDMFIANGEFNTLLVLDDDKLEQSPPQDFPSLGGRPGPHESGSELALTALSVLVISAMYLLLRVLWRHRAEGTDR